MEGILIFEGTHHVMAAEKVIKGAGIYMKLIPVPRSLTSDCGLAIRIDDDDRGKILSALNKTGNYPKEYYVKDENRYLKKDIRVE
ncbi:MAG: DUF3343 domain-containing protein [Deltaproteobacteria bacterium]|nr:DUF3343 domain-containing protein [Deltaproteobacteria bacterium]